jgi:AcrR family transcriptional regulator
MTADRPRGRTAVVDALLSSAQRLVAERGSSDVALREVAEDAGVNFGLVYQYIGTKDQLLTKVYERAAENAARQLQGVEHLDEAVDLLMRSGDGTMARLIARAALDGTGQGVFSGASPAVKILADLAERDAAARGNTLSREQAQVFAALAMVTSLGWRLFGSIALAAADLDTAEQERYSEMVRALLRRFAGEVSGMGGL